MKVFKFILLFILTIVILGSCCLLYAFKIEPYRLKVNEFHLTEKKTDSNAVKIVQFSDTHVKNDFTYENLDKVVNMINSQKPDIVIFTGDLYDNYGKYNDDKNVIAKLQKIEAKYEKIAIWGNRDYGGGAVRQYENIMTQSGFTLLKNENRYVTVENDKKILFTGLDDSMLGNIYMPDSTKLYDANYQVLLNHEPDVVEDYLDYNYNLVLSGHSHGGQVNIPFLPAVNKKAVSATSLSIKYTGGLYNLDSNGNEKMYVNTGIGTTHISARFGVVPEVSVFYISL